jgi:hypothetical protein
MRTTRATRHSKMRRPPLPPILEIDEDGLPVSEMSLFEGRRFSGEGEEPGGVSVADWPTEFDD